MFLPMPANHSSKAEVSDPTNRSHPNADPPPSVGIHWLASLDQHVLVEGVRDILVQASLYLAPTRRFGSSSR